VKKQVPILVHLPGFRISDRKPTLRHSDIDDVLRWDEWRKCENAYSGRPAT
jgi:hypothetical protein